MEGIGLGRVVFFGLFIVSILCERVNFSFYVSYCDGFYSGNCINMFINSGVFLSWVSEYLGFVVVEEYCL